VETPLSQPDPSAASRPGRPRRPLAPRIGLAAIGVVVGLPFLWAAWQHTKPTATWYASVALKELDCTHPEICRLKASASYDSYDATMTPFRVRSNSLGFRGPERSETRPEPRTLRIQLYGDSNTFGIGAHEGQTLADDLEAILRERHPDRPVEVMNFGLPANFLRSNLIAYRDFGRRFTPDVLVFCQHRLGGLRANDINWRVRQTRESPVLGTLMKLGPPGRFLVNAWQTSNTDGVPFKELSQEYSRLWAPVIEDVRARGMRLATFSFVETPGTPKAIFPAEVPVARIGSDLTEQQFLKGPYVIPRDGHPNREGVRHFATLLADGLEGQGLFSAPPP
jgi:hypothetical protein